MIARPSSCRLTAASELIAARLGLHYPPARLEDLARVLGRTAPLAGYADRDVYLDSLLSAPLQARQLELLASTLTVGETYFYRDPRVFDLIAQHFVPRMFFAQSGLPPRFRIWSAGCCTGEEAYTLAILFDRMRPLFPSVELDLLATDINPVFLGKARAGIYRPWSFRDSPPWLQADYFTPIEDDRFEIRADLRREVRFAPLNLAEFTYPSTRNRTSAMDLILCRHVLMYFTPEQFSGAVHHLAQCLVEGGWLILSAAEVSHVSEPELVPTRFGDTTVFVKRARRPRVPEAFAVSRPDAVGEPALPPPREWNLPSAAPVVGGEARAGLPLERPEPAAAGGPAPAGSAAAPDLLALARSQASQGDLASALATCNRLLEGDKMHPVAHYLRATSLQEQGAAAEAERALRRVLYLEPDFIAAYVGLASLARHGGRPAEARRQLRQALALAGRLQPDCALPETDGLPAGRLVHLISSVLEDQLPAGQAGRAGARGPRPHRLTPAAQPA